MEGVKILIDSVKSTTYELLALVLPGAILLLAALSAVGVTLPGGTVVLLGASYAAGMALQGIGDFLFKRSPLKKLAEVPAKWKETQVYALRLINRRLDHPIPDWAVLDVCLTRVEARRTVYDKFTALRDTARGLAVVTPILAGLLLRIYWSQLTVGSLWLVIAKLAAMLATTASVFMAFAQRYTRFHPLAQQVVYGQFIALEIGESPRTTGGVEAR